MHQQNYWIYEDERSVEKENYIATQMEIFHREAVSAFSKIVNKDFIAEVMTSIAYAFDNEDSDAIALFKRLNLDEKHAASINGNEKKFDDYIIADRAASEESYFECLV